MELFPTSYMHTYHSIHHPFHIINKQTTPPQLGSKLQYTQQSSVTSAQFLLQKLDQVHRFELILIPYYINTYTHTHTHIPQHPPSIIKQQSTPPQLGSKLQNTLHSSIHTNKVHSLGYISPVFATNVQSGSTHGPHPCIITHTYIHTTTATIHHPFHTIIHKHSTPPQLGPTLQNIQQS